MALKKQVRELKGDVGRRDEELDTMRKNMKHTSIQEKDYEIVMLREECGRLTGLIDEMRSMKAAELKDANMDAAQASLYQKDQQLMELQTRLTTQASEHQSAVNLLKQEMDAK